MPIGRLHILTDHHLQRRFTHAELARRAIEGGADTIQFREKGLTMRQKLGEAEKVAAVCNGRASLIIDDHVDLAQFLHAGVHLGQHDLPISTARLLMGNDAIIGATGNTVEMARNAWQEGASYIGYGPVYPTEHKENLAPVRGLEGLAAACRAVPIPVIAIAGITVARVAEVLEAGAHGVAVLGAVCLAEDPAEATAAFRRELDRLAG